MQALKECTNRLSIQNLINAYCVEVGHFQVLKPEEQSELYRHHCNGNFALSMLLEPLQVTVVIPLIFASCLGQHQISGDIFIISEHNDFKKINALMLANLLLQDILYRHSFSKNIDIADVLARWMDSAKKLKIIFQKRHLDIDAVFQEKKLNFIESEQSLFYGHAMHPSPKSRLGFSDKEWIEFSPETNGCFKLHYWLVSPNHYIEESDDNALLETIRKNIFNKLDFNQKTIFEEYQDFKLLILHPWQAKYLREKNFYQKLLKNKLIIDLGQLGENYHATTSVRTVANLDCSWMFKLSLSVSITNSVRINLPKEGRRGLLANKIWNSQLGENIRNSYPMFDVINDPAWIGLVDDGEIINESICIIRKNPFNNSHNVTNLATLCQDHPYQKQSRLHNIIKEIHKKQNGYEIDDIAQKWFNDFLEISLIPMVEIYHKYGMVFEAHQQNTIIELRGNFPYKFLVRDNQSFGYVEGYADDLVKLYPELDSQAQCVVPIDFANSRFVYYFIGNTVFSLVNSIAKTGFSTEQKLISILKNKLYALYKEYPNNNLLKSLLFDEVLDYKGNLLTRLNQLDELTAPLESQSVYVKIKNPIKILEQEVNNNV